MMKRGCLSVIVFFLFFVVVFWIANLFNSYDLKDDDDVVDILTEAPFPLFNKGKTTPGGGSFVFKKNGTFEFRKIFNNDGVDVYYGTYTLGTFSESKAFQRREMIFNFTTSGEFTRKWCPSGRAELRAGSGKPAIDFCDNTYFSSK